MEYRGVEIELHECRDVTFDDYQVAAPGMLFWAECKYGRSFGLNTETVLQDIKAIVDNGLR